MYVDELRHRVFPAVPVPHGADGRIDRLAQSNYAGWLAGQPIGGVAIWTSIGRGIRLDDASRAVVLDDWRARLGPGQFLIAGAGSTTADRHPDRVIASALSMARRASDGGADAILVHPPTVFRGRPELDTLALAYQDAIGSVGLPVIVSYVGEAGGGIAYRPHLLAQLVARPNVIGIQVATVDSLAVSQDVVALVRDQAPGLAILSGENRFLGYSLMSGADTAMLGLASGCPRATSELLAAHRSEAGSDFFRLSRTLDDLARRIFTAPSEGAAQRMLWYLADHGLIPPDAAFDPWSPRIGRTLFDAISVFP